MKTRFIFMFVLFTFFICSGYSQDKPKQSKEERKFERQKQTDEMINSQNFVFTGMNALPQGGRSVSILSGNNTVKFQPEFIKSEMPFFGELNSGAGYDRQTGMVFEGKPDEYTVKKTKKGYLVEAVVKANNEIYDISLSVGSEGSASLTILSNNRSAISYTGEIKKPE